MKHGFAWAGVLCLVASGCAQNGLLSKMNLGDRQGAHVVQSRSAPRPTILRAGYRPGTEMGSPGTGAMGERLADFRERADVGRDFGDGAYQCSCDVCCGDGCDTGCEGGCSDGCQSPGRCRQFLSKLAGGGCNGGGCPGAGCMAGCNPHAGGYPEMPAFNPGPPVGQTAYPYYTVRGPRDFLRNNPPTIGPY